MNVNINALDDMESLLWVSNGSTSRGFAYSPFGSTVARSGNDSILPGFNGERLDPVNQSYHLGNGYRTYNPTLMRFNAPDSWSPFGAGGPNQYAYCEGEPINRSDPSGHMSWRSDFSIVLSVLGILSDIFTLGASIPAIAAACAALSMGDAAEMFATGWDILANTTSIASTATQESDPEASQVLGWCSFAFLLTSFTTSAAHSVHDKLAGTSASYDLSNDGRHSKGRGADSSPGNSLSHSELDLSDEHGRTDCHRQISAPADPEQAAAEGRTPRAETVYPGGAALKRTGGSSDAITFKAETFEGLIGRKKSHRNFYLFNCPQNLPSLARNVWGVYFAAYIVGQTAVNANSKVAWASQQIAALAYLGLFGLSTADLFRSEINSRLKQARWKKVL